MKIYLSGPISGRSEAEARDHFADVAYALMKEHQRRNDESRGKLGALILINPMQINCWRLSWETYMQIFRDLLEDPSVDAICMLKGWENSKGAKTELALAAARGKTVIYEKGAKRA